MNEFYTDYLYNNNYIKKGEKILVDPKEFGEQSLIILSTSGKYVKAKSSEKEFKLNLLREFQYNFTTKTLKLLPFTNKYKIIYSIAMSGTYEEDIMAHTDNEAIDIFKKTSDGKQLKNCEVVCIKVEESFVKKVKL